MSAVAKAASTDSVATNTDRRFIGSTVVVLCCVVLFCVVYSMCNSKRKNSEKPFRRAHRARCPVRLYKEGGAPHPFEGCPSLCDVPEGHSYLEPYIL